MGKEAEEVKISAAHPHKHPTQQKLLQSSAGDMENKLEIANDLLSAAGTCDHRHCLRHSSHTFTAHMYMLMAGKATRPLLE